MRVMLGSKSAGGAYTALSGFEFPKAKPPSPWEETGVGCINSLTMSYFHTGTRTIIGAEAFHCPVRDGKEWDHLAMVIRLNLLLPSIPWGEVLCSQFVESELVDSGHTSGISI